MNDTLLPDDAPRIVPDDEHFIPLGNQLLVELPPKQSQTAGGLFLPDQAQKAVSQATVIRAGRGQKNGLNGRTIPCQVRDGDRILFAPHGLREFKTPEGTVLNFVSENDVFMILDRAPRIPKAVGEEG